MADSYYAKWHLRFGGAIIRPGEVFEASDRDPELVRLLELGAAARCGGQTQPARPSEQAAQEEKQPLPAEPEAAEDGEDEKGFPAEIDAMDGIVTKPRRRSRK